jgi:hypothetical protein
MQLERSVRALSREAEERKRMMEKSVTMAPEPPFGGSLT